MGRWRAGLVVAVVAVVVGVLLACGSVASPASRRVSVWGDSLTVQARTDLSRAGAIVHAWGGTAPCDWLSGYDRALTQDHPTVVVIAFVGNAVSRCMADTSTRPELAAKYRTALAVMGGQAALTHHVRVVFVVPPLTSPGEMAKPVPRGALEIGRMECALAATAPDRASCSTAARDLLSPAGVFTPTLDGRTIRDPDGVHLAGPGVDLYAQGLLRAAA